MTLKRAIALLQLNLVGPDCVSIEDLNEAQKLGIKALQRVDAIRRRGSFLGGRLLVGETPEQEVKK